jgi:hypothetical protein
VLPSELRPTDLLKKELEKVSMPSLLPDQDEGLYLLRKFVLGHLDITDTDSSSKGEEDVKGALQRLSFRRSCVLLLEALEDKGLRIHSGVERLAEMLMLRRRSWGGVMNSTHSIIVKEPLIASRFFDLGIDLSSAAFREKAESR